MIHTYRDPPDVILHPKLPLITYNANLPPVGMWLREVFLCTYNSKYI